LFESHGIPIVPTQFVSSPEEAVAVAARLLGPVAVKVSAPTLTHKTDVGGVVLGAATGADVATAYTSVVEAALRAGHAPDGAIVAPMRDAGVDLLLGTVHDDRWGTFLVLGMGGIDAEAFDSQSTRLLPVSAEDVRAMLDEIPAGRLLTSPRRKQPADMERLVEVIHAFGELASGLGPALLSAEINPLRVRGAVIEALDGLIEWAPEG
jgi:succinyl-CoA synthetase beta subunit